MTHCSHRHVVPAQTWLDGSVDGVCLDCGVDDLPWFDPSLARLVSEARQEIRELYGLATAEGNTQ